MSVDLPSNLVAMLRERKALLWICQRAELAPGAEIHDESTPLEDAIGHYRPEPNQDDSGMANIFWEACWTESIVDRFYDATSAIAESEDGDDPSTQRRMPYRFAADPDNEGQIDRRRFLPIYEVNGTSRDGDPEGQHGGSRARRFAYKMGLIRRLENFLGRAVVVVGALDSEDLDTVRTAMEFMSSSNMVVILWPFDSPIPEDLEAPSRLDIHFLRGTRSDLIDALARVDAPQHSATPKLAIRYGRSTLELREEDLLGVDQDFALIRESDFEVPTQSRDDATILDRLWRSESDDWMPFASEMVFRRHYQPLLGSDVDLANYVISQLHDLSKFDRVVNMTLTIPATSGSGITTSLRHTAFVVANSGFPSLLCRPANQRFSVEKLGAFLNRLQERGREQFVGAEDTPALIVFDRQHRGIEQVSELATMLAARGRHALIIEVIPPGGEDLVEGAPSRRPKGRHLTAQEFRGDIDRQELQSLSEHFSTLYRPFGMSIPTFGDWLAFQGQQTIRTSNGEGASGSHFWIALQFFVGEGNPYFNLAEWVGRTFHEEVRDRSARQAVRYIAALSSFGITVPLTPLLRSVGTTTMLDSSVMPTLRRLSESEDLLQWGDSEEYLHDHTISFKHRLIAIHLLEILGVIGWEDRLRECWGLLETLRAGPVADSWLVEALVFEALRVERFDSARDRLPALLETLEHIPTVIAGRSASTLHHWARALGLKARHSEDTTEKIVFYFRAVKRLELACDLAESERGREHPRNIYNSLGVMRSEFSRTLREDGKTEQAEALWQSAAAAFDLALGYGSDNFVVLSAYAQRLIEHAQEIEDRPQELSEIASALSFLAQAEETASLANALSDEDMAYIERKRNEAWNVIDPEEAERHIERLINEGNEIGIVLKAYRALGNMSNEDWEQGTASQLANAYEILSETHNCKVQNRSWRSVFLLYRIVSALRTKRYNFQIRLNLLDELDTLPFRWYSGLRFAQAVLCYQTGDFRRGFNLFRDLRSKFLSGDLQPIHLTSFWRDPIRPSMTRQASVRIQQVRSDWVAYGEVPEMNGQRVLTRPRWFDVQPRIGDVRPCNIAFERNGPLAVPTGRRLVSMID